MKMKKFAALAAATVMSVSAIAATSAFGVFATTDAGVNNIVIKSIKITQYKEESTTQADSTSAESVTQPTTVG